MKPGLLFVLVLLVAGAVLTAWGIGGAPVSDRAHEPAAVDRAAQLVGRRPGPGAIDGEEGERHGKRDAGRQDTHRVVRVIGRGVCVWTTCSDCTAAGGKG